MERIRVLFLAANPQTTSRLRLSEETRKIQERIALSQGPVDLQTEWAVRIRDLQHLLLKHRPHVVHFSGHGVASGEGVPGASGGADLVLEADGVVDKALVSGEALAALFAVHRENVRCVVLNACHSQRQAAGIARSIDFVIGMSRPVQDQTAIAFAAAFYQGLGFGRSVKDAFEMGRVEAQLNGQTDHDVPQLLARDGANAGTALSGSGVAAALNPQHSAGKRRSSALRVSAICAFPSSSFFVWGASLRRGSVGSCRHAGCERPPGSLRVGAQQG